MKKNKIISIVMMIMSILMIAMPVMAANDASSSEIVISNYYEEIKVLLNNEPIDFTDENGNKVPPQLINDRTMVPMRKIFETLNAEVAWEGETETVTATAGAKTIKLQINSLEANVTENGNTEKIMLDSAPVVYDGRTLVPVRFVSETLGLKVGWDDATQTVIIIDPSYVIDIVKEEAPIFYELMTMELEEVNSAELKNKIEGTLTYTNKEDKSMNSNIKLSSNGNTKYNKELAELNIEGKITGKGEIFEVLKEEGLNKFSISSILDLNTFDSYIKSSLLEDTIGKKWAKQSNDMFPVMMISKESTDSVKGILTLEVLNVIFDSITIDLETYDLIGDITRILCKFVSDEHFTISGRNSKTYTYQLTLEDVKNMFGEEILSQLIDTNAHKNMKIKFSTKIENNVNTEAKVEYSSEIVLDSETIVVDLSAEAIANSINKGVNISIPQESEVIELD